MGSESTNHRIDESASRRTGNASRVIVYAILAGYLVLGAAYVFAAPIFEKPDEVWHFAYIKSLVDGRGFPTPPVVMADDSPAQEVSQPPLYYVAAAAVVRLAAPDTSDWPALIRRNPVFPYIAEETQNDNKNVLLHDEPGISFDKTARAVYLARLIALAFGALSVAVTHQLGRETFPTRPGIALIAAAFVAFLPQFAFISTAISNDSAAVATCGLALWATARVMRRGPTPRRAVGLGLALALAALSKASAVALIPLSILAIIGSRRRERIELIAMTLMTILIIAGPWFARSLIVFGDVLGTSPHLSTPWARPEPLALTDVPRELPGALISFWLAYGWGNILAPDGVYAVLNALGFAGLIGAGLGLVSRQNAETQRPIMLVLWAWLAIIVVSLLRWVQLIVAPLGRLAFPALPAIAVLMAVGWTTITPRRAAWLSACLPLLLLALSAVALPAILLPAYTRPVVLTEEEIERQSGWPIDVRFGDVARLIRIDVPRAGWPKPGDEPGVRLCWETLSPDPRPLLVLTQLVGADNRVVATRRTLPGLGAYPTSAWQPGARFCDTVRVPIAKDAPAPGVYQVEVALFDPEAQVRLPAYAPDGSPLGSNFVDRIKITPAAYSTPFIESALDVRFGDQIDLIGYALEPASVGTGESIGLRLYWRAARHPDADYTVLVHVRDASGRTLTQADGQPQRGAYPTSFWDAGEVVIDDRTIDIPADAAVGAYTVVVGLYELSSGDRLPLADSLTEFTLPVRIERSN